MVIARPGPSTPRRLGRHDPNHASNEDLNHAAPNGGGILLARLYYNHVAPNGAAASDMAIGDQTPSAGS